MKWNSIFETTHVLAIVSTVYYMIKIQILFKKGQFFEFFIVKPILSLAKKYLICFKIFYYTWYVLKRMTLLKINQNRELNPY